MTYPYVDCFAVLVRCLDEDELVDAEFVSDARQAPIERHAMTETHKRTCCYMAADVISKGNAPAVSHSIIMTLYTVGKWYPLSSYSYINVPALSVLVRLCSYLRYVHTYRQWLQFLNSSRRATGSCCMPPLMRMLCGLSPAENMAPGTLACESSAAFSLLTRCCHGDVSRTRFHASSLRARRMTFS